MTTFTFSFTTASISGGVLRSKCEKDLYWSFSFFFLHDGQNWSGLPVELTAELFEATSTQADPAAQWELTKKFMKGIHIFEYDHAYFITQTMTNEEFQSMMDEAVSLISGLIPNDIIKKKKLQNKADGQFLSLYIIKSCAKISHTAFSLGLYK